MAALLNFSINEFDGIRVIKLTGTLSEISGVQIESALYNFLERESIIIDCSDVILVTMGGLKYLVDLSLHAKDAGNRIVILYPGEELRSLAEKADMYHLLIFAESPDECITKIRHYT